MPPKKQTSTSIIIDLPKELCDEELASLKHILTNSGVLSRAKDQGLSIKIRTGECDNVGGAKTEWDKFLKNIEVEKKCSEQIMKRDERINKNVEKNKSNPKGFDIRSKLTTPNLLNIWKHVHRFMAQHGYKSFVNVKKNNLFDELIHEMLQNPTFSDFPRKTMNRIIEILEEFNRSEYDDVQI